MKKIRFFTLPPEQISWPYVLINLNNPNYAYLERHRKNIQEVIIDTGIEIFRDPKVKEYPRGARGQIIYAVRVWDKVRYLLPGRKVWATIMDYPDDYHPGNLWLSNKITNIERTLQNVIWAIDNYPDVNWLIPVQGWNKRPKSIIRSIKYLEEHGIIRKYNFYAIANLCVENEIDIIKSTLIIARKYLKNKRIHSFGINMKGIAKIWRIIDTVDSNAWTRPCGKADIHYLKVLGRKRASRKNDRDSIIFFLSWVYTLVSRYNVRLEAPTYAWIKNEYIKWLSWALKKESKNIFTLDQMILSCKSKSPI